LPYVTKQMAAERKAAKAARRAAPAELGPGPDAGDSDQPEPRKLPGSTRRSLIQALTVTAMTGALEATPAVIHATMHGLVVPLGVTVAAGAAGGVGLALTGKRRGRIQTMFMYTALGAAIWIIVGTMFALHGDMQVVFRLLPPAAFTAVGLAANGGRPEPVIEEDPPPPPRKAIEPPPVPDEVVKFQTYICGASTEFGGAVITGFRYLGEDGRGGFTFKLAFPIHTKGTVTSLGQPNMLTAIAKLFHNTPGNVTVEHDPDFGDDLARSEAHAQVTVTRPKRRSHATSVKWDPRVSTYNADKGGFELSDYPDDTVGWWEIHRRAAGVVGGLLSGVPGSGKTSTANVILTQSGLACWPGTHRRFVHLITLDPQKNSLPVWKGRSTIHASGEKACLYGLEIVTAIGRSRADWMGTQDTTDAMGRIHHGRGSARISPDFPIIQVFMDELPMMTDPEKVGSEAAKRCTALLAIILLEFRKVNIELILGTQTPDQAKFGWRREIREILAAWSNVVALRCDTTSADMIGIRADPAFLPKDYGYAYAALRDPDRPAAQCMTRFLKDDDSEDNALRQARGEDLVADVYEVADLIASMPAPAIDPGMARALDDFGFPGIGWVITDDDVPQPEETTTTGLVVASGPSTPSLAPVEEVMNWLLGNPDGASAGEIAVGSGQSLAGALSALAVLQSVGQVTEVQDGRYAVRDAA
jgi:hypothetical protein